MGFMGLIKQAFLDGDKGSFSRIFAMPFLLSAWFIGTASGVMSVWRGQSAIDDVITLAAIAVALYTGSKTLSLRGQRMKADIGVPEERDYGRGGYYGGYGDHYGREHYVTTQEEGYHENRNSRRAERVGEDHPNAG